VVEAMHKLLNNIDLLWWFFLQSKSLRTKSMVAAMYSTDVSSRAKSLGVETILEILILTPTYNSYTTHWIFCLSFVYTF
jgi:hypothetical protein